MLLLRTGVALVGSSAHIWAVGDARDCTVWNDYSTSMLSYDTGEGVCDTACSHIQYKSLSDLLSGRADHLHITQTLALSHRAQVFI